MTQAVLADTGPLYAAADEGDAHHHKALEQFQELARQRREVLVPYPIWLESYSLILSRLGWKAASAWLAAIAGASLINPTPEDYSRAHRTVRTLVDQRITLVDASVAALAERLGLEVWTFDHHFDVMRVPVWR